MSLQNPLLRKSSRPLPRSVVVVGAGTIGPDIGYYLKSALPDVKLHLLDVSQPALDRAMQRFTEYTEKAVARRKMSAGEAEKVRANVHATTDYQVAHDADWAIEAATEDLALKRKIFAQLEALMRPDAWITSNTSSLPAARIFAELKHKNRATVTHFFAPAWRNPVVEVIDTPALDRAVLEDLRWLFCTTGKVPLVTADVACFMLDRVFDNWCNEAAHLLDRASAAEIEFDGGRIRPCRAVLRAQSRPRQSDHHRDQHAAGRRGKASIIGRRRCFAPPAHGRRFRRARPCRSRRRLRLPSATACSAF